MNLICFFSFKTHNKFKLPFDANGGILRTLRARLLAFAGARRVLGDAQRHVKYKRGVRCRGGVVERHAPRAPRLPQGLQPVEARPPPPLRSRARRRLRLRSGGGPRQDAAPRAYVRRLRRRPKGARRSAPPQRGDVPPQLHARAGGLKQALKSRRRRSLARCDVRRLHVRVALFPGPVIDARPPVALRCNYLRRRTARPFCAALARLPADRSSRGISSKRES